MSVGPTDDQIREWWRSVQGPKAEINGPIIRLAHLAAGSLREALDAAQALNLELVGRLEEAHAELGQALAERDNWKADAEEAIALLFGANDERPESLAQGIRLLESTCNAEHDRANAAVRENEALKLANQELADLVRRAKEHLAQVKRTLEGRLEEAPRIIRPPGVQ